MSLPYSFCIDELEVSGLGDSNLATSTSKLIFLHPSVMNFS